MRISFSKLEEATGGFFLKKDFCAGCFSKSIVSGPSRPLLGCDYSIFFLNETNLGYIDYLL